MKNALIVALDFPGAAETLTFLDPFEEEKLFVKIGMELFYSSGPSIIGCIKEKGHGVFLDLKLHDIPHTVMKAMRNLALLDVDLVTVHAAGGKQMMEAALEGLEAGTPAGKKRSGCVAVTQLTSTSEQQMNQEQLIKGKLEDSVLHYASLTKQAGLDGVVCSTHEAGRIHTEVGSSFLTVTPGIRLVSGNHHDQKRVATPEEARRLGADAIVVGRAITDDNNPLQAYRTVLQAWEGVLR